MFCQSTVAGLPTPRGANVPRPVGVGVRSVRVLVQSRHLLTEERNVSARPRRRRLAGRQSAPVCMLMFAQLSVQVKKQIVHILD